ncbi:uncharacterized protein [Dysidea avara]|uniref:uncharacterized protein isoform X1 n=2 Tax=Dysidea avara TaxID=196820 RepID=UPI00331809EE
MYNVPGHIQPLSSTFVDLQRQAAAAYVNYGPITNDQLHQLQYHGIPIHQQQHSPRSHPPTASNNNTMENQLRALLPGINISIDSGAQHPLPHNNTHYTSSYPTQQVQPPPSQPIMPHAQSRSTLPLTHRPAVTSSRHVIASPFDIPSLSYVTTTIQSGWPDLINSSDSRGGSVSSSSVGCVGGRAMMREPVTASHHHQPQPTVFPSNPEPFLAPVTSRTTAGTTHQVDGECNKREYKLWSDNSSFGMCLGTDFNLFSSYATEYHQTIIKEMQGMKSSKSSWLDLCSNGDSNIPPSGLEFHNTQLLPDNDSQQSATVNPAPNPQAKFPQQLQGRETVEQSAVGKPKQNNTAKFTSGSCVSQSNPLTTTSVQDTSRHVGASKSRNKPNQSVTTIMNYSSHHYTGPHYSRLQAAPSSSGSYQRNSRHSNYHQHHHNT